jgi:hypothetical protein
MTELLAIAGTADADEELLDEIAQGRPDRVTVLVEEAPGDWALDESEAGYAVRDRLAGLLHGIEQRTGAVVVGLAGDRGQLADRRYDRVLRMPVPLAA